MAVNPPTSTSDPFSQYQVLIEDSARLSDRRQTVNNIYVSANSLLIGALALLIQVGGFKSALIGLLTVIIAVAGFTLCIDWRRLILNYRDLLRVRFTLLHDLEARPDFPFPIKTYHREDETVYSQHNARKRISFFGFSRVETRIPVVFMALYSIGAAVVIVFTVLQSLGVLDPLLKILNLRLV